MKHFSADITPYRIALSDASAPEIFPYVRAAHGPYGMYCISPIHGRSFVLKHTAPNCWVVGKGNGLSYTQYRFLRNSLVFSDTWGGLTLEKAQRDFLIGQEVQQLGIKTNSMQYVLELDWITPQNGEEKTAALLQYTVECPYRLSDFGFIPNDMLRQCVSKWQCKKNYERKSLVAADILVSNLRILHDHDVMHNALHTQNYTWALELLDFEAARTNNHPYESAEYESFVPQLKDCEILQTYEVINYIIWCLQEQVDFSEIDQIFSDYGFDLRNYSLDAHNIDLP